MIDAEIGRKAAAVAGELNGVIVCTSYPLADWLILCQVFQSAAATWDDPLIQARAAVIARRMQDHAAATHPDLGAFIKAGWRGGVRPCVAKRQRRYGRVRRMWAWLGEHRSDVAMAIWMLVMIALVAAGIVRRA